MENTEKLFYQVKQVFNVLEDEMSKDIFINRFLYSMTDDLKYVDIMIRNNVKEFSDKGINVKGNLIKEKVEEVAKTKKVVIYGAGQIGLELYRQIGEYVTLFCDRDIEKQKNGFHGCPVISPEQLCLDKEQYAVVIGSTDYFKEIYEWLTQQEVTLIFENKEDYIEHMFLEEQQYFDEKLIQFKENEVFIDGGCLNFLTSKQLLERCHHVKAIYAFEPDPISAKRCEEEAQKSGFKNYKIIEKGLYSKETELYFNSLGNGCSAINNQGTCKVRVTSIDKAIHDKVTFIKMDIEGAELQALIGAKEMIIKNKPRLAISVYHKDEDIIEIPLYIKSLVPEYKLYLRHYSNHAGETVLYAIHSGE